MDESFLLYIVLFLLEGRMLIFRLFVKFALLFIKEKIDYSNVFSFIKDEDAKSKMD